MYLLELQFIQSGGPGTGYFPGFGKSSYPGSGTECALSPTGHCNQPEPMTCGADDLFQPCPHAAKRLNAEAKRRNIKPEDYQLQSNYSGDTLTLVQLETQILCWVTRGVYEESGQGTQIS